MATTATRTAPLWVIEMDSQHYLCAVKLKDDAVHIMSGRADRPKVVQLDELVSLRLAADHEDGDFEAAR
jgi:hypothetical protein